MLTLKTQAQAGAFEVVVPSRFVFSPVPRSKNAATKIVTTIATVADTTSTEEESKADCRGEGVAELDETPNA
jgi:hypothetical protein